MPVPSTLSITLPLTAVSASTPMPIAGASAGSSPAGLPRRRLRIRLPCTTASRPPLSRLAIPDTARCAVDNVVGDDRASETELNENGDLSHAGAGIADDLEVRSGVATYRRIGCVADAVAAHDDVVGAIHIDAVAPLAGAALLVGDVFDAVVDNQRAVIAGFAAPDQDAAIAGAANRIAGDAEAYGVIGENGIVRGRGDGIRRHLATDLLQRDAVAAGIDDFAIGDAHRGAFRQMDKPTAIRQRDCIAVEDEAAETDVIAAARRQQRRTSSHDQPRRTGDAGNGGIGRQLQRASAKISGRQPQHRASRGGALDGALKIVD